MSARVLEVHPPAKFLSKLLWNWEWGTVVDAAANEKNAVVDGPFGSNLKLSDYIEPPGVPVLTTRNLREGFGPATLRYISLEKSEELSRSLVRGGDILMAKIGSCGVSCIYPNDMVPAIIPANLLKMTVHPSIHVKYAHYYFSSEKFHEFLQEIITATAQPAFNVSKFRFLPFAFAPALEQRRIVAEIEKQFSRLEAAVAALKRVQSNLKRYRASVLKAACEGRLVPTEAELARAENRPYEPAERLLARILKDRRAKWEGDQLAKMRAAGKPLKDDKWKTKYKEPAVPDTANMPELPEGWVWATVEQISTKVVDGVHQKPTYVSRGVPFVTVRNLTAGPGISMERLNHITLADHDEFTKRADPGKGDLLISKDGTLGVVRAVRTEDPFSIFVSVALVKPALVEMSDYLEKALSAPQVQIQMVPKGSGLQHIHLEDLRADCVPLPPLPEQGRIAAEADRRLFVIDELEATVEANLKRAERLRQAILKRAFEGKLVPQDPNDEPASVLLERIRAERSQAAKGRAALKSLPTQLTLDSP